MPPEQVQVKRICERGRPRTRRARRPCALASQRRTEEPGPARLAVRAAGSGFAGGRPEEDRPCGGADGDQPAGTGSGRYDASARGHDDVTRPCPGHRAPTASVDAPISFTYHFPLCRSTTDIPYVISSFDAIPRFPAADPGCSGSCQITVTLI